MPGVGGLCYFVVNSSEGQEEAPIQQPICMADTAMVERFSQSVALHSHIVLLLQLGFDGIQPWEHYVPSTSPGCFLLGHSFPMAVIKACW